jgi:hypothetical protein
MSQSFKRAVLALSVFLIPAIASAQEDGQVRECKPVSDIKKLPAVSALLDSASLIANLPAPDAAAAKELFVSVTTGSAPKAFVMDSVAAKTESGRILVEKVLASLKPNARNLLPSFRLQVLLGETPRVSVLPSLLCPPKGKSPPRRASFSVISPSGPGASQVARPRDVEPRIKIGVNGEVLQVDLGAGTGYPDGDRSLREALQGQQYEPALLDGRPVQVWLRGKNVEIVR